MMYLGMVVGSVVTTFWRISKDSTIWMLALDFSAMFAIFLWIAADDGSWHWEGANIFLVILLFLIGICYGVLIPTLVVTVDEQYPQYSLVMNQVMSIVGIMSMFCFVWIALYCIEVQ